MKVIEEFITVHYVMGFFLIAFTTLMAFSFFTTLIRRVFNLLDEIVIGYYTSKGGNYYTDPFESSNNENTEN